jgi:chemosensory pili system protein ChpA (sensor histidine kinase/response regulator)
MPYQILVADDDANIRELAALHLRAAGYSVRLAEDGVAAGYAVLESLPDLILCDLHMPRMTGLEFVAALRADTTLPRIPVLFLSSMDEGADRAQQLGAVEYLLKPLRADSLLGAVSRHLPRA